LIHNELTILMHANYDLLMWHN